jgi:hypothetical protein
MERESSCETLYSLGANPRGALSQNIHTTVVSFIIPVGVESQVRGREQTKLKNYTYEAWRKPTNPHDKYILTCNSKLSLTTAVCPISKFISTKTEHASRKSGDARCLLLACLVSRSKNKSWRISQTFRHRFSWFSLHSHKIWGIFQIQSC